MTRKTWFPLNPKYSKSPGSSKGDRGFSCLEVTFGRCSLLIQRIRAEVPKPTSAAILSEEKFVRPFHQGLDVFFLIGEDTCLKVSFVWVLRPEACSGEIR